MKESEYPKNGRGRGGSKKNISAGPKNLNRSVQVDGIDEKPALNYKSMPSPASPELSGLMAEAVVPLEYQQPPKMNGPPPDQESGLKTSIADANVETIKPCLDCPSQVFVGPFHQKKPAAERRYRNGALQNQRVHSNAFISQQAKSDQGDF